MDLHKDATVVTVASGAKAGTTTLDVTVDVVGSTGPVGTATTTIQVVVLDPRRPPRARARPRIRRSPAEAP